MMSKKFDAWIRTLDETVIQGDFGYEPGEFTVYPDHWRPLFDEGLSPADAFQRALDSHKAARDEEDRLKRENWELIREEGRTP